MSTFTIGQQIGGRYRLDAMLARGGMGAVYRATDERIGRPVAIKVLLPELSTDTTEVVRFQREATAVASLHHPGIVQVLDVGREGQSPYLVMEHVAGRTISEILAKEGKFEPSRAADIIEQALFAVSVAHAAGIVHRDLKPGNVMLVPTGGREIVKVLDFGIAQLKTGAAYTRLTQTGAIVGTPSFMAPEQANGNACDARTDVYAMGVVFWCMLTGKKAFAGRDMAEVIVKVLHEVPTRADRVEPSVPAALASVCEVALQKKPEARFATASAFATALVELRSRPSREPPPPAPVRAPAPAPAVIPTRASFAPGIPSRPDPRYAPTAVMAETPPRLSAPGAAPVHQRVSAPAPAPIYGSSPGVAPAAQLQPPYPASGFVQAPPAASGWRARRHLAVGAVLIVLSIGLVTCIASAFAFQSWSSSTASGSSPTPNGPAREDVCEQAVRCCEAVSYGSPGCAQIRVHEQPGMGGETQCSVLLEGYRRSAAMTGRTCD